LLKGAMRLDAEYYQPKYLATAKALAEYPKLKQFLRRSIIHPTEIKRVYEDGGYPFALSQNIGDNWLDFSQQVFIPQETAKLVPKNKVEVGDVLMIRTGQVGKAAPYLGEPGNLYASAHVLIIKIKDIPTIYLSTYLNSKFGRILLERGTYGASQPELSPSYVEIVPIPRLGVGMEQAVESMVLEAHEVRKQSEPFYLQAEQLLLDELGFRELGLSHQLFNPYPSKRPEKSNALMVSTSNPSTTG
jgi:type I restriction enzyme S subunit